MDQKDLPSVSLHLPRWKARYVQGTFRFPFVKVPPKRDFWGSVGTKNLYCIDVVVHIWALWYSKHKLHTKKWYYLLRKGGRRGSENTSAFTSQLQQANLTGFANNLHCSKFILGELRQRSDFSSTCKLNEKRLSCWLCSAIMKSPNQPIRHLLISITIE